MPFLRFEPRRRYSLVPATEPKSEQKKSARSVSRMSRRSGVKATRHFGHSAR